jgi:hypothetical protein
VGRPNLVRPRAASVLRDSSRSSPPRGALLQDAAEPAAPAVFFAALLVVFRAVFFAAPFFAVFFAAVFRVVFFAAAFLAVFFAAGFRAVFFAAFFAVFFAAVFLAAMVISFPFAPRADELSAHLRGALVPAVM